jgi:D-alanyl-lipoteichoic acid acyltransferase DltB (MBOAT superfamily)
MLFYSWQFFLLLPVVFLVHWRLPDRWRWVPLLVGSGIFYGAFEAWYLLLALALVVVGTYGAGLFLAAAQDEAERRRFLVLGIGGNLLLLVVLKYLPFLADTINACLGSLGLRSLPAGRAFLSIGVSYYVFQAISYLWDIRLGTVAPERHLGYFALYLGFFPKLLQGPLERAGDLLPQLKAPYRLDYHAVRSGMLLFTWGMFQKLVVADRLGLFVDAVYGDVQGNSGLALLLATYMYAAQLLYDFGGYTDMALGIARMFGISLTRNFAAPYGATSVAEFWRRWHISFSRWLLDYIFKPLSLVWRNGRNWGSAAALMVTFLVSGIWHGASWGFVMWGGLHGLYLAASLFWRPQQKKLCRRLGLDRSRWYVTWQVFVTFHLVCFGWVFFRAASLADAWHAVTHIAGDLPRLPGDILAQKGALLGDNRSRFFQCLPVLVLGMTVALCKERIRFYSRPAWFRWAAYYALVYGTLYFSVLNARPQFIYFRF